MKTHLKMEAHPVACESFASFSYFAFSVNGWQQSTIRSPPICTGAGRSCLEDEYREPVQGTA